MHARYLYSEVVDDMCMHVIYTLQIACAEMLLHALSKGDASPLAANALQAAVWAQPGIAALVCLGRGDKGGAARALVDCTSAEQARILATFSVEWRALDMRWRYSTRHKPTQISC